MKDEKDAIRVNQKALDGSLLLLDNDSLLLNKQDVPMLKLNAWDKNSKEYETMLHSLPTLPAFSHAILREQNRLTTVDFTGHHWTNKIPQSACEAD